MIAHRVSKNPQFTCKDSTWNFIPPVDNRLLDERSAICVCTFSKRKVFFFLKSISNFEMYALKLHMLIGLNLNCLNFARTIIYCIWKFRLYECDLNLRDEKEQLHEAPNTGHLLDLDVFAFVSWAMQMTKPFGVKNRFAMVNNGWQLLFPLFFHLNCLAM